MDLRKSPLAVLSLEDYHCAPICGSREYHPVTHLLR